MKKFNLFFICLLGLVGGKETAGQPDSLFARGNRLYAGGDYEGAKACYDSIALQGYQDASLFYNLGNTHYKLQNLAWSVWYYEKARKLNPGDPDIQENLAYVNLGITDRIQPLPEFFMDSWWRSLLFAASLNTWSGIATVFWLAAFGLLILYLYTWHPPKKRLAFYGGIGSLACAILLLLIAYSQRRFQLDNKGAIVFKTIAVKSAPSENEKTLFIIHEGSKVEVMERESNWLLISLPNGHQGWVKADALKTI